MGMAASQARYLGLTARKTNVEYEGQQINQARTALGNQSATLWNQMLTLSIPTVPKTTDYTTVQYSFSDGYNDYTISNLASCDKEIDGVKYNTQVTYYYNQDTYKGVQAKNTNPQAQNVINNTYTKIDNAVDKNGSVSIVDDGLGNLTYSIVTDDTQTPPTTEAATMAEIAADSDEYKAYLKANNLTELPTGEKLYGFTGATAGTVYEASATPPAAGKLATQSVETLTDQYYMMGNSKATQYDANDSEQKAALDQIRHDFPALADVADTDIYTYQKNGQTCFATKADIEKCIASGEAAVKKDNFQISSGIDYQDPINQYYATTLSQKVTAQDYAIMDDSSGSGRYSDIKLSTMSETFDVASEEVTDEKSYNDAMNQYNYDVTCYEKAMSDINAKTSVIQEQDRTLELRLKQLDTEQKALSTEMDAVKGIISKNVESTFKTFSS